MSLGQVGVPDMPLWNYPLLLLWPAPTTAACVHAAVCQAHLIYVYINLVAGQELNWNVCLTVWLN